MSAWFVPQRLVLWAVAAVVVCGILPTVAVRALGFENSLWFVKAWWTGPNGGDSWLPIKGALEYIATGDPAGFYQAAYYETVAQFIYPPMSLVFFRLTQLPPAIDWMSMAAMNYFSWWLTLAAMAATTAVLALALRRLGPTLAWPSGVDWLVLAGVAAVGTVFFFPFNSGYHNGNIQTWLNLLVLGAIACWLADRRIAAGMLIGLVCIIKPQLSLIGLWALVRREFGMVAGIAAVVGAFGIASLAMYGFAIHFDYMELMSHLSRRGESFVGSHSVNGLLNRMLFIGNNTWFDPWHKLVHYDPRVYAGTMAAAGLLILPTLWPRRSGGIMESSLDLCIALVAFTLASPIAYVPHFGFMLPIFWIVALAILRLTPNPVWPLIVLAVSYALASKHWLITDRLAETGWNFVQSTMLYAALMLIGLMYWLRARAARLGAAAH